jgi:hypothetical protein
MKYESYAISQTHENGYLQGTSVEGNVREFALVVNRDLATNELTLGVARHYDDPDSQPAFEGSSPWQESETLGQDDS